MIKPIVHDPVFLGMKSEAATSEDLQVAKDLLDTLVAHKDSCVGMAANMIGERKRIIVFNVGKTNVVMFNPVIVKKDKPYETEEGCLSLIGERACTRYENIEVVVHPQSIIHSAVEYVDGSVIVEVIIQVKVDFYVENRAKRCLKAAKCCKNI